MTMIQVYAPTSDYTEEQIEEFYTSLQNTIHEVDKKDIMIIQGDWNAKVGKDTSKEWDELFGPACNNIGNERGLLLLEFAHFNNMILANTLGKQRTWTWHSPDNKTHNQIDYILVQSRYKSGVSIAKTRTFPGADVNSDHDLVMMTFRVRLKEMKKPKNNRLKFNLEKLKYTLIAEQFQASIGGKFGPLLLIEEDIDSLTNNFSAVMMDTAKEILGNSRRKSKPWVTEDILDLCDKRREVKKKKDTVDGKTQYREINKEIRKEMKKAKQTWIDDNCDEIEKSLTRNNSKKAFQLVKDLTKQRQSKVTTIQDKNGNSLTEEYDIIKRWSEYCSELYNFRNQGDPSVLNCAESSEENNFSILRSEVASAVNSLKSGKSPGIDNIPAELLKEGGDSVIYILTIICNKIWATGEWPKQWTQSLIITLPKKGNLQLCQNYRTISIIK